MLAPDVLLENRYRIVRLGERFSVGVSYEAVDERLGGEISLREWAAGGTEASREAFIREAQLLNAVFHIGLPYVSDLFETADGWYSVFQKLPGQTLGEGIALRGAPFTVSQVAGWLDRVLDVLEFFHALTPPVVVSNVGPQSIHITPRNDAVLTDFGLAVEAGEVSIGYILPYAPIEQIEGEPLQPSADVYAVGATAYHLLTLIPPPSARERDVGLEGGAAVVLRSLEELNSSVSPEVAGVIYRALAVDSAERYQTAMELRKAFGEALTVSGSTWRLAEAKDPTRALEVDEMDTTEVASVPPSVESRGPRTSVVCRSCGSVNDAAQKFCPRCGGSLKQGEPAAARAEAALDAAYNDATGTIRVDERPTTLEMAAAGGAAHDDDDEAVPPADAPRQRAFLHVLEGEDPGAILELSNGRTLIGRAEGTYTFPLDIFMSGRHTVIERRGARFVLFDDDSRNGTFVRLRSETRLTPGDTLLVGKQLLRFELDERSGKPVIGLVRKTGTVSQFYDLRSDEMVVGRSRADINFPDDQTMAERHLRIVARADAHYAVDCGTRNGTFVRLRTEFDLANGDVVIVGKHIFRFELLGVVD
ncbi:MAG TPA: FHA domain-containing protein [Blastocatellia bacterium]|nr:FHA domain-containing protein [Blastocatellia bacterium]